MQNVVQRTHADFVKPGVVYGMATVGTYGRQNAYYFGRSKQASLLALDCTGDGTVVHALQKELLKKKCKRVGLNAPKAVLLWARVADVDEAYEELRLQLRNASLTIVNELHLGDNWYTTEEMGPEDFGKWCRATMLEICAPPEESARARARIQRVGDEMLIGPVSSEVAAAAVCGVLVL